MCFWNNWKDQRAKILILNQTGARPSTGTAGEIVQLEKKIKISCVIHSGHAKKNIKKESTFFAAMIQQGAFFKKKKSSIFYTCSGSPCDAARRRFTLKIIVPCCGGCGAEPGFNHVQAQ